MRTHYGERSTAATLDIDKETNVATAGPVEVHGEGHAGNHQGVLDDGEYHERYNDFKIPAGPVPGP
eukprot:1788273-Prorocentrum_lima.AAC.1